MKHIILYFLMFISVKSFGQFKYDYNSLPDSVKKNAQYIIWEDLLTFEVIDQGKAKESGKLAVCILNSFSTDFNSIYAHYRKNESINQFDASIYDMNGKLVKKLKNNEIKDVSSVSDFSLYEDDRVKYAQFVHNQYPYTLVFEYEKKVDGLLHYPVKVFQRNEKVFVLNSAIKFSIPDNFKFRYRQFNMKNNAVITHDKSISTYFWNETNLKPRQEPDLLPHYAHYESMLRLAPVQFSEGGFSGNIESWKSFGEWNLKLNEGRDDLPDETKQKILSLVEGAKTDAEKARRIYEYMQNKTRYISIQMGIGGYQPFSAEYVDTKGYGDCKALSNYTQALLKTAGIKSHYARVYAGEAEDNLIPDFPSSQFNHIILCVPNSGDTLWLECTSQKQPFNFLGSFTDDRHALLITEDGGKLVKTPRYPKEINTCHRNVTIDIDSEGNAIANIVTVFRGLQYEKRANLAERSLKDQHDFIKVVYPISGLVVKSCQFIEEKEAIPCVTERLELDLPKFASISNKRMFVKLNQFCNSPEVPKNEDRTIPFQLRSEFIDFDTIQIRYPEAYKIESLPKNLDLIAKFGSYSSSLNQDENSVILIRNFSTKKNTFEASEYKEYYEFVKQIVIQDKGKMVLVKKD